MSHEMRSRGHPPRLRTRGQCKATMIVIAILSIAMPLVLNADASTAIVNPKKEKENDAYEKHIMLSRWTKRQRWTGPNTVHKRPLHSPTQWTELFDGTKRQQRQGRQHKYRRLLGEKILEYKDDKEGKSPYSQKRIIQEADSEISVGSETIAAGKTIDVGSENEEIAAGRMGSGEKRPNYGLNRRPNNRRPRRPTPVKKIIKKTSKSGGKSTTKSDSKKTTKSDSKKTTKSTTTKISQKSKISSSSTKGTKDSKSSKSKSATEKSSKSSSKSKSKSKDDDVVECYDGTNPRRSPRSKSKSGKSGSGKKGSRSDSGTKGSKSDSGTKGSKSSKSINADELELLS
mmetsp:Transcript_17607/g.25878  ORF Transcript_17607/g.25878 Transcript_17607/m.25878 type:complete len:343 (-) Transcript_17607:588-1616(-)